jgi:hypothetical protein
MLLGIKNEGVQHPKNCKLFKPQTIEHEKTLRILEFNTKKNKTYMVRMQVAKHEISS